MPQLADNIYHIILYSDRGLTYQEISDELNQMNPGIYYDYYKVHAAIEREWRLDNYVFYEVDGSSPIRIMVNPDYYKPNGRYYGP